MVDLGASDLYHLPLLILNYFNHPVYFGDNGLTLGWSGLKELFHSGQTAGNIKSYHAAGVEGAQS